MARVITSKSRKVPKQMGDVVLKHGNAAEMGGFKHFRVGHELARPVLTADGTKVYSTPSGKQYVIKPMSS
jgi:hypothetical protein